MCIEYTTKCVLQVILSGSNFIVQTFKLKNYENNIFTFSISSLHSYIQ